MKKWLDNILELSKKENWSYKEFHQYIKKVEKRIIIYEKYLSNKKDKDIIYAFIQDKTEKLKKFCIQLKKILKKT